jgi:caspase domain-containing protein
LRVLELSSNMKLPSSRASFRSRLLAILISIGFGFTPAQAQLGKPEGLYYKSWGVVIGIENYLLAPKIPGAIEDAKAVAQVLHKLGFEEVLELYDKDASSRRLQQTLVDFLPRKVGRQDRLVIYFAGHAGITQAVSGKILGTSFPGMPNLGTCRKR